MGLIKSAFGAAGGVMADQWKEYFYCEAMPKNVLMRKGHHRASGRSSNTKGNDNVITNGSVIAVADGQCMLIVDQGRVAELCAEPGEFVYDASTEPSIFSGKLSESLPAVFKNIGKRFTFGGEAPKDQRVYYINTKELIGNKFGTPTSIPFRVVDKNIGLDLDTAIRCFGEYSYRITNPILFYTNLCGNISVEFDRSELDSELKGELLDALQPAFARLSEMGIRYSALPGHTTELSEALNNILSKKWGELRGIEIVSFAIASVKISDDDEKLIKELQRSSVLQNAGMAAGHMAAAQAAAMQAAASNTTAGPAMAFMGMNMAGAAGGMNTGNLFAQAARQQQQQNSAAMQTPRPQTAAPAGWNCSCGQGGNSGKFCMNCGSPQPAPVTEGGWVCSGCSHVNKGRFCSECGAKKPAGAPLYKCDKCGWEPSDPSHPPRFCPSCGDAFGDEDIQ